MLVNKGIIMYTCTSTVKLTNIYIDNMSDNMSNNMSDWFCCVWSGESIHLLLDGGLTTLRHTPMVAESHGNKLQLVLDGVLGICLWLLKATVAIQSPAAIACYIVPLCWGGPYEVVPELIHSS